MDGVSVLGVTQDMTFLGGERSTLGAYIADAASRFGFTVVPDAHPEQGFFYRSDHFNFARIGVPSLSLRHGRHFEGHEPEWGEAQWKDYRDSRYHRPSDEYDPDWDLTGAEQTARIAFYLAYRISESAELPAWNPGDEFAAARARALDGMAAASN
jgi:Zn-dependent M28 family amino/carboxypeptidase